MADPNNSGAQDSSGSNSSGSGSGSGTGTGGDSAKPSVPQGPPIQLVKGGRVPGEGTRIITGSEGKGKK